MQTNLINFTVNGKVPFNALCIICIMYKHMLLLGHFILLQPIIVNT